MNPARARQEAAKKLGLALQGQLRTLLEAVGEEEITAATVHLASNMYENVEFIIWALKKQGGMDVTIEPRPKVN